MRVFSQFALCCVVMLVACTTVIASPSSKITVRVVNENGLSMKNAGVEVWYAIGNKETTDSGNSDDEGLFVSTGESAFPQVTIYARALGYYESCVIHKFNSRSLLNRWEPWNPTIEVELKKKRNPVAMYDNHRTSYKLPKLDEGVGFDLAKEDWVTPYGRGLVSDFIVTYSIVDRGYSDYECRFMLSFSNEHDGIQEYTFDSKDQSSYKWPFQAPINGYSGKISKDKFLTPGRGYGSSQKKNANYLFRVRSKVDKEGNIVEAKYGKLVGEFGYDPNGQITFRYIFNPDGTRNLEEDPKKNLFKNK